MLFHIAFPENPDHFDACIEKVKEAYWPQKRYQHEYTNSPPPLGAGQHTQNRKKIDLKLAELTKNIPKEELYTIIESKDNKNKTTFPFLDRFHKLFLVRKWDYELARFLSDNYSESLFQLESKTDNCSKNAGNFNHFINVVAATARLINYFSNENPDSSSRVSNLLSTPSSDELKKSIYDKLSFDKADTYRIFTLMLSAFYHDLGKTVVNHRHGMEGAIILLNHSSRSTFQLRNILNKYNEIHNIKNPKSFDGEEMNLLSCMLEFHDFFGTLSTGETGYTKLVPIIDRFKRKSATFTEDKSLWTYKYLFDLWLLNVADILVSREESFENIPSEDKWVEQKWWKSEKDSKEKIENFFKSEKASSLCHDLIVSTKLLDCHLGDTHRDDQQQLINESLTMTRRHTVERLRRLISECISQSIQDINSECISQSIQDINNEESHIVDNQKIFLRALNDKISEKEILSNIIFRSIEDNQVFNIFCENFSYIGQMDYSLGFFIKISKTILQQVLQELVEKNINSSTNYVRPFREEDDFGEYFWDIQTTFFIDNYTSIVIHIITAIIERHPGINKVKNLEFNDAVTRLTKDKIISLANIAGPSRHKRSTKLILQSIMYW